MGRRIRVTSSELYSQGTKIHGKADDYRRLVNQLYSEVEAMRAGWRGVDNLAYADQVEGFREDLNALASVIDAYAVLLKDAAVKYSQAQSRALQAANKA